MGEDNRSRAPRGPAESTTDDVSEPAPSYMLADPAAKFIAGISLLTLGLAGFFVYFSRDILSLWPPIWLSAALTLLGLGILFVKHRAGLDAARRRIVVESTLFFGMFKRRRMVGFDDVVRVRLSVKYASTRDGPVATFRTSLEGEGGRPLLEFYELKRHECRRMAEELGRAIGVGLLDESTEDRTDQWPSDGPAGAEEVGIDSISRVGRGADFFSLASRCPSKRIAVRASSDCLRLGLPRRGLRMEDLYLIVLGSLSLFGGLWMAFHLPSSLEVGTFLSLFAGALCLLLPLFGTWLAYASLRTATTRFNLEVRQNRVRIQKKAFWYDRVTEVSTEDVLELKSVSKGVFRSGDHDEHLGAAALILVRTGRESLLLGDGLTAKEVAWLKVVLGKALAR